MEFACSPQIPCPYTMIFRKMGLPKLPTCCVCMHVCYIIDWHPIKDILCLVPLCHTQCRSADDSPTNVFSQRPAFHSLIVLSADPVSIRPCSGNITTAHTAAVWPWQQQEKRHTVYRLPCKIHKPRKVKKQVTKRHGIKAQKLPRLLTCKVIMHLSFSHTLAVVSQEPLRSVPNFPAERLHTAHTKHQQC